MSRGIFTNRWTHKFNALMLQMTTWPVIGSWLKRFMTNISYVGRKSGKRFSTPVIYLRRGSRITIPVGLPDSKTWWRNFLDDEQPITLHLPEGDRTGLARAHRNARGGVKVTVELGG